MLSRGNTEFIEERAWVFTPCSFFVWLGQTQSSPADAISCQWEQGMGPKLPYLLRSLSLLYLEVMEKKAIFFMLKERGSWSGRWPRQGCLQTEEHGESGNASKGGGKKGGNGSMWDWMEKDTLGVRHINGLSPKPFLLQAAPALSASPGGDNSHTEGFKLGLGIFFLRNPLAWCGSEERGAEWVWAWLCHILEELKN